MRTTNRERWQLLITAVLAVYLLAAYWTFALRHPWATGTQITINIGSVLTFQTIEKPE